MTQVTVSAQPVSARVSGETIVARVPAAAASAAAVTGGVGPQGAAGPQGPQGPPGATSISAASDVELQGIADGDVLRYSSNRWRNYPDANLVDGGNFVIALLTFIAWQ